MKTKNLTDKEDSVLIKNIKEKSCNTSLKELINRHGGICFSMGKKFSSNSNFNISELTDNKDWIIYLSLIHI